MASRFVPPDREQEMEIVIKFRNKQGEFSYDKETESRHIAESARIVAENLKRFGYKYKDIATTDGNHDNMGKRRFVITLLPNQKPDELKRRLESIHGNRSWTYCEVF